MCTAISYRPADHYFGRNLDLEHRYHEVVAITPRRFPLAFRSAPGIAGHYAMIGMATCERTFPLYYEATNEAGLSAAGLSFPGYAHYLPPSEDKLNIAPFELIPWLLAQCRDVAGAKAMLEQICLAAIPFSDALPLTPMHFMICDRERSIVAEPTENGLMIYDNPAHVLANSPPFPHHLLRLCDYMQLTPDAPVNRLDPAISLSPYSRGMGAQGLPGDLSSVSRFVRAAYMRANSISGTSEEACVSQFFHLLASVRHVRGSVMVDGQPEITLYSSCCNTDKGVYYFSTYENSRISAVDMHRENLDDSKLIFYPMDAAQDIRRLN